jgi:hypothetical protein
MSRNAAVPAAVVAVALACHAAPARAADDALVGTWAVDHDGYTEFMTIKMDKGDWSASGTFRRDGAEVGSWQGGDVEVAGGKLICTQKWVKKPDPTWGDNTTLTAQASGDKLTFMWDSGGNSGKREMTRAKTAAADGSDLVGTWKCDHDGFTEIWVVKMDKGQWAVSGSFLRKGKEVGLWAGVNPQFADGKLTCAQKYVVKPVATWSDGVMLTAQLNNDKLDFTWDNGGGQSGSRQMTRAK